MRPLIVASNPKKNDHGIIPRYFIRQKTPGDHGNTAIPDYCCIP